MERKSLRHVLTAMLVVPLLGLGGGPLAAQDAVDELVQVAIGDLDPDVLAEPGSTALAEALAEMLAADLGLAADDAHGLRLRTAEAWLDAGRLPAAQALIDQSLAAKDLPEQLRDRAGLAWLAAWELAAAQTNKPDEVAEPAAALDQLGSFSAQVFGRAWSTWGQHQHRLQAYPQAIAAYDQALKILSEAGPRARVPILTLSILSREAAGAEKPAIVAWLNEFDDDPAVKEVLSSLLTDSDKMIGQPAPGLAGPRLAIEGGGVWQRADLVGKPLVVYFMATWCAPCAQISPVLIQAAAAHPEVAFVAVSLDTRDTVDRLPAYLAKAGIQFPVIGESLGWDGELDDIWKVHAIPAVFVVDADGDLAAMDLTADGPEVLAARLQELLPALVQGEKAAPPIVKPPAAGDEELGGEIP